MTFKYTGYIILSSFLIFMIGCGSPEKEILPKDALSIDQFAAVLIDIQISEGIKSQHSTSNIRRSDKTLLDYDAIYAAHGVSENSFAVTYDYYRSRPAALEKIYEQVLDSLIMLDAEVKQQFTIEQKAEADSLQAISRRRRDSIQAILSRK